MSVQLTIPQNWNLCPEPWRNFASDIHAKGEFLSDGVFWLTVRHRLKNDFNARFIGDANRGGYIEFANEKDLTMFMLRWS